MRLQGILKRVDLGTGAWVLETPDGQRYQLVGAVPGALKDRPVRVDAEAMEAMGFAMVGPILQVQRIEAA
jgi:hypothetical protein